MSCCITQVLIRQNISYGLAKYKKQLLCILHFNPLYKILILSRLLGKDLVDGVVADNGQD